MMKKEKRSQWAVIVHTAWSLLLLPALWSWHCWGSWPHPCAVAATVAAVVISMTGIPVMSDNRHGNPWTLSQVYLRPMSEIRRNKNVIEWDQLSIEMSQEFIKWEVSKRQSVKRSVGVPRLSSRSRMEHFPPVCALTCLQLKLNCRSMLEGGLRREKAGLQWEFRGTSLWPDFSLNAQHCPGQRVWKSGRQCSWPREVLLFQAGMFLRNSQWLGEKILQDSSVSVDVLTHIPQSHSTFHKSFHKYSLCPNGMTDTLLISGNKEANKTDTAPIIFGLLVES